LITLRNNRLYNNQLHYEIIDYVNEKLFLHVSNNLSLQEIIN